MTRGILEGKVALVTGGSVGIGRAAARMMAQQGADVALNYLTYPEEAEKTAEEIRASGRRATLHCVDVSDQLAVEAMVGQIAKEMGSLDVLMTNAVYSDRELFYEADMAGFRRTIDVTMWGAFYALRAATNQMLRQGNGGSVVVISSPHARVARVRCMAYNMAKAALDQMARTAALELVEHKIRVNLVYPGWTSTPGERKFFSEEQLEKAASMLPTGRMVEPEEVARAVLFLVDPASEQITGSTITVDGGGMLPWWSKYLLDNT